MVQGAGGRLILSHQQFKNFIFAKKNPMKRLLLIIFALSLFSCGMERKKPEKPVAAVSILPQRYLINKIADTLVDVVVMVPPGASPATWEATPEQMKDLGDAFIYFRIGHIGFEQAWMKQIASLNPGMEIVDLSEGLELISADYEHGDHQHHGTDPHTWLSPACMKQMARKVYYILSEKFPDYKSYLRGNYEKLLQDINKTESYAGRVLSPLAGSSFLIFHPSLGYLARDYSLNQYAIEFEGKEPSPAHLREIVDLAKIHGIKAIFVQKEFDQRNASLIAEEIEGTVVMINPLEENWIYGMKQTIDDLAKYLK